MSAERKNPLFRRKKAYIRAPAFAPNSAQRLAEKFKDRTQVAAQKGVLPNLYPVSQTELEEMLAELALAGLDGEFNPLLFEVWVRDENEEFPHPSFMARGKEHLARNAEAHKDRQCGRPALSVVASPKKEAPPKFNFLRTAEEMNARIESQKIEAKKTRVKKTKEKTLRYEIETSFHATKLFLKSLLEKAGEKEAAAEMDLNDARHDYGGETVRVRVSARIMCKLLVATKDGTPGLNFSAYFLNKEGGREFYTHHTPSLTRIVKFQKTSGRVVPFRSS